MSSPRIVVLMGCYNEAGYLSATVWAVLSQTMPDFALLLLDNGSTDGSTEMLRYMHAEDARIALIRVERNLPPANVANLGIGLAMQLWPDCRWFVTAGADDLMAPDYLEAILATIDANPDANLVFSPWQWIGHPERGTKLFPRYDPALIHLEHQIPAWSAFTRELWDQVGEWDPNAGAGADWSWVVRASAKGLLRPVQLDRPYLSLRVREGERKSQSDEVDWPTLAGHLSWVAQEYQQ